MICQKNFFQQLATTIDQRLARLKQALHDEPHLINSNDREIRERLDTVEELKHQVTVRNLILLEK